MIKNQKSSQDDDDDRSQFIEHIPSDLIVKILSRLPAKWIGRSRSISKLWSSITTTPYFINSFAASSRPCVLLIFSRGDKVHVFSYPQVVNFQFTIPDNGFLYRYDSVQGLIYLETSTQLMIWNPTIKRFFNLPKPNGSEGKFQIGYFGYDPIDCKYKAFCFITGNKFGIFTLGAQESWRILPQGFSSHFCPSSASGLCINGVVYCEGYFIFPYKRGIMSFDLRSEKLSFIKFPDTKVRRYLFVSYKGKLGLMINSNGCFGWFGIELWILEDADNHKWKYKSFPSPNLTLGELELKGITDAGEFIYICSQYSMHRTPIHLTAMEKSMYEWVRIVYFDPRKNTSREVKFRGIAYDDFRRLDVPGDYFMKGLSIIPNHTESLMSL